MKYQILAGPARSGKTTELCKWILDQAYKYPDKKYIMVVPEQVSNAYEKKLIRMNSELHNRPGFLNVDVLGFNRLAFRIFGELGIQNTQVMEEFEKNMLVRVVAGRKKEELEIYGGSVDRMGFIKEVKSLISEMLQYDVSPDDLDASISIIPSEKEGLIAKLKDVSKIYHEFTQVLAESKKDLGGFSDDVYTISEERLKLLIRLLKKVDMSCDFTDGTTFVFDEFRGFTPDQLGVIGALSKRAEGMRFSLCIDEQVLQDYLTNGIEIQEHDIFHQSFQTYIGLQMVMGEKPEVLYINDCQTEAAELKHLTDHVFRYPAVKYDGPINQNNIQLFHTDTLENEIRIVAEDIRRAVKSGYRYRDVVVVTGDIEKFDNYAERVFTEYEIPAFYDYSRPLRKNPYSEAILRILDIFDNDFDYGSVFGFLKTGIVRNIWSYHVDQLENYVLRTGIRGRKLWKKPIRTYGKTKKDKQSEQSEQFEQSESRKKSYARLNQTRKEVLEVLSPMLALTDKGGSKNYLYKVHDIIDALYKIMEKLHFKTRMENAAEFLEDQQMMTESKVMTSLYTVLEKLLEQTDSLLGDEEMSIHDFKEILASGIGELKVGVIPPTMDSISVCDIDRSRILSAKIVYVVGINDGVIPAPKSAGRILSDKDKDQLIKALGEITDENGRIKTLSGTGVQQSIDELFLIYQVFSKATDKLSLSYHDLSESAKGISPSFLLGRVSGLYPGLQVVYRQCSDLAGTKASDRRQFIGWVREALEQVHNQGQASPELCENIDRYIKFSGESGLSTLSDIEHLKAGFLFNNKSLPISNDIMKNLNLRLSVSKIETYAGCPYEYLMQYVLGLKERPEKKIEFYSVGNIMHSVFEKTFNEVKDNHNNDWSSVDDDKLVEIANGYLEEAWDAEMNSEIMEQVNDVLDFDLNADLDENLKENQNNIDSDIDLDTDNLKLEEMDGKARIVKDNLYALTRKNIIRLKEHIIKGKFSPLSLEQKFTAEFTAKRPDDTDVTVTINGIVDRIDSFNNQDNNQKNNQENNSVLDADNIANTSIASNINKNNKLYLRIVDYKTGNKSMDALSVKEGRDIQLLVYSKIVSDILEQSVGKDNVIPAGVYYYNVDNPEIKSNSTHEKEVLKKDYSKIETKEKLELKLKGITNDEPLDLLNLHEKDMVKISNKESGNKENGNKENDNNSEKNAVRVKDTSEVINADMYRGELKKNVIFMTGENLKKVEEYSVHVMKEKAEEILAGKFEKAPMEGECSFCSYKSVCRFNEYAGKEKYIKLENGNMEEFNQIAEKFDDKDMVKLRSEKFILDNNKSEKPE